MSGILANIATYALVPPAIMLLAALYVMCFIMMRQMFGKQAVDFYRRLVG